MAQVLRHLADGFPAERFPDLLVGLGTGDDAAVYRLDEERALIATVDYFTPVVDDPYQFGAIAAVNAMSDVYAMGGRVVLALNICCLSGCLPVEVVREILRGGADKVAEAGGVLAGGHSVDDREPKYGLAVIGFVDPQHIWTKAGARPGDALVLTKPLGVGMVTTAWKGAQAAPEHMASAVESMLKLNRWATELLQPVEVHACTDVTGFSLLGHACEMAEQGGVQLSFSAEALPFVPGARDYAEDWLFPEGTARNWEGFRERVAFAAGLSEELQRLLFTPETSGGLLAAVPRERLEAVRGRFASAGEPLWVVGEVRAGTGVLVEP